MKKTDQSKILCPKAEGNNFIAQIMTKYLECSREVMAWLPFLKIWDSSTETRLCRLWKISSRKRNSYKHIPAYPRIQLTQFVHLKSNFSLF